MTCEEREWWDAFCEMWDIFEVELAEEERWFEFACCCMGCGLRRRPLPEKAEMWLCPECEGKAP